MDANERAEAAAAAAFGRVRAVTEADQQAARAFGRAAPELSEGGASGSPEDEMLALLGEYRELRVSRLGESRKSAEQRASFERALMSETVGYELGRPKGRRFRYRVTSADRLAALRETVEGLRAQVPLSAGSGETPPETYTAQDAEEAAAAAFGRTTKGGGQR